ncbi:metallophosphoesterase [Microvirga lotononidis]|uniref:Putative phosphohydrolase n=1 Tax=Microvirga lotononidis TaxID=864069 RepID=I4YYE7_9HYPH|nr:metallophosphoesterase [Microvirga lotononidis]EIM28989.1 putative phosphohydrolase [Microvirga lotononidis]WQO26904.1 metallophosphoesterase [Microvirga lotononidis]
MFHLTFALPSIYVLVRFVWPLPWAPGVKIALAVALLMASQYHLWSRLSSGSVFSPEFPRAIVLLFNWAFGAIVLLAGMQIALDVAALVVRMVRPDGWATPDGARYTAGIAAMLISALGVSQAIRVPPLKDVEIAIPGLSPQFEGYRLLQLTDLHISRLFPREWTQAMVMQSNALDVDMIVVTGDLIDGSFDARDRDVEPLRDLHAKDGVWVVPGNHEYFFGYEEWMRQYANLGMQVLTNDHVVLNRDGGKLVLAGVTDLSASRTRNPAPDLSAALAGAPADAPIVLLDHQPRNAARAAERGIALQLSGHTHGGMILGLDRLVARANNGFVSGQYQVGNMTLYVNNGTALWPGFALRLGRPSELTRITLRRAAQHNRHLVLPMTSSKRELASVSSP